MNKYAFIKDRYANFSHLIYRVSDEKEQDKYVDRWTRIYTKEIKDGNGAEKYQWDIRIHKSLKEVFTSVCFHQESLIAKESMSWAAFFFLSYYSLFHALMSCVVLLPSESIEKLSKINHSKLIKVFKSNFCDQKPFIIREDIDERFYMFKYLREYYSYNMPPNDFLYESDTAIKPDQFITFFIYSCGQLASLHSEIIERCFQRHPKKTNNLSALDIREWYVVLNCPEHPRTGKRILHYSDEVKLREVIEGPSPLAFTVVLEHFIDEFRLYEGAEFPKFADGTEIDPGLFVYRMLRG